MSKGAGGDFASDGKYLGAQNFWEKLFLKKFDLLQTL